MVRKEHYANDQIHAVLEYSGFYVFVPGAKWDKKSLCHKLGKVILAPVLKLRLSASDQQRIFQLSGWCWGSVLPTTDVSAATLPNVRFNS